MKASGGHGSSGASLRHPPALPAARRAAWAALACGLLAVFLTARMLLPAPGGVGTHTQLGLPPCGFLALTSFPCPGCGLTTAFAHLVRFELKGAWVAQPAALPLFALCLAWLPVAVIACVRAWPVARTCAQMRTYQCASAVAFAVLFVWVIRVAQHAWS